MLSSPLLLGFEEIERQIDRATKGSGDGYPPYNIERINAEDGEGDTLRITLAVAGFTRDQLEITLADNQLTVRGKQVDEIPYPGSDDADVREEVGICAILIPARQASGLLELLNVAAVDRRTRRTQGPGCVLLVCLVSHDLTYSTS